ncbi:DUF4333 domain-containing protein [Mycobacterium sp. UM_WWY]
MSGPQGSDPAQQWPGQQPEPGNDQPSSSDAWQQPASPDEPTTHAPTWQPPSQSSQPEQPQQQQPQQPDYSAYQQSHSGYAQPQYPSTDQYSQPYAQPGQFGQPGQPAQMGQPQFGQPGQYGQPQFGQPGQYGQPQFGQPGQPGQFGQYNQPGAEEGSKRSLGVILGVVGALVVLLLAVVGVLGFWKPGWFVTTELDVNKAQEGVTKILTDEENGYGNKSVSDVNCNDGKNPKVKKGDTFTCEVSVDGTKRKVTVTFQNNDGTYEVGRPK